MIRNLIGVMGPGETASQQEMATAYGLGRAIAEQGWVLLTGGRPTGVMDAASQGARAANGLVVGVLPGESAHPMSSAVDIPIVTGLGSGRNVINVLSSRVVVACGLGTGTLSEIALALKLHKPVILMEMPATMTTALLDLTPQAIATANTVDSAIAQIHQLLMTPPGPAG